MVVSSVAEVKELRPGHLVLEYPLQRFEAAGEIESAELNLPVQR
jgi:hypothetical protein